MYKELDLIKRCENLKHLSFVIAFSSRNTVRFPPLVSLLLPEVSTRPFARKKEDLKKKSSFLANNKTWWWFCFACREVSVGCEVLKIVVGKKRSMYSTVCLTCLDSCCLSAALWKVSSNAHLSWITLSELSLWAYNFHPSFSNINDFVFLPDECFSFDSGSETRLGRAVKS